MRIIAFGDVHMALGDFKSIPDINEADLVIITGDLTNYGARREAGEIINAVMSVNKNLLALPGNLDQEDVNLYLSELELNLHGSGRILGDIGIFGIGGSNTTPFNTPLEFSEEELAGLLAAAYKKVRGAGRLILVSHTPPFNTAADRLSDGIHVGSKAVRDFIEDKQPDICLTGHIHEARAEGRLGKTHIINPGMIKDGGWIEISVNNRGIRAVLQQG